MGNIRNSSRPEDRSSALQRLRHSCSGTTTLEYALLLAMLVAIGMAVYLGVSSSNSQIFNSLAKISKPNASSHHASLSPNANSLSPLETPKASPLIFNGTLEMFAWLAIVAGILLPGCILLHRRLHHLPKGQPSGDQIADEQLKPGTQRKLTEKRQQIRRLFLGKAESSPGFETQVRHLMSSGLKTITPKKSIAQATALMDEHRIRHLLVCKKDGQLLGIISDRDLKKKTEGMAKEIMTPDPITVSPEMAVGTAITIMLNHSISCLPVIEQGEVTGLLTTTDLILSLQCTLQVLSQLTRNSQPFDQRTLFPASTPSEEITENPLDTEEEPVVCC